MMRVNVYAEEMTDRVEIVEKRIDGQTFTGLRFYLELPATLVTPTGRAQVQGPFLHRPGDDDSSAVTFWGKSDLRRVLRVALDRLDQHYDPLVRRNAESPHPTAAMSGASTEGTREEGSGEIGKTGRQGRV